MGEYLREEVMSKLGDENVHISVPKEKLQNCFDFELWGFWREFKNAILPHYFGRVYGPNIFEIIWILGCKLPCKLFDRRSGRCDQKSTDVDIFWGDNEPYFYNTEAQRTGETPSAGSYASARGLAKLAAAMANEGQFEGKSLMSKSGWLRFHSDPRVEREPLFEHRSIYTLGGLGSWHLKDLGGA